MKYTKNQIFVMKAAPDQWADYANELRNSMDYLWERKNWGKIINYDDIDGFTDKSHVSRTWLLLASFAIENLIKGLLIAQNPMYISNGRLSRELTNHKLLNLARSINGISLTSEEQDLLNILETCIPSWGRYPIPISIDEIRTEVIITDKIKLTFKTLFIKYNNQIEEILTQEWKGL